MFVIQQKKGTHHPKAHPFHLTRIEKTITIIITCVFISHLFLLEIDSLSVHPWLKYFVIILYKVKGTYHHLQHFKISNLPKLGLV